MIKPKERSVSATDSAGRVLAPAPIRALDPSRARTRSLASLSRRVSQDQLAQPVAAAASLRAFFSSLPDLLAARDLLQLARCIGEATRAGRLRLLMMGAHPLKVGLGPLICDLIRGGVFN